MLALTPLGISPAGASSQTGAPLCKAQGTPLVSAEAIGCIDAAGNTSVQAQPRLTASTSQTLEGAGLTQAQAQSSTPQLVEGWVDGGGPTPVVGVPAPDLTVCTAADLATLTTVVAPTLVPVPESIVRIRATSFIPPDFSTAADASVILQGQGIPLEFPEIGASTDAPVDTTVAAAPLTTALEEGWTDLTLVTAAQTVISTTTEVRGGVESNILTAVAGLLDAAGVKSGVAELGSKTPTSVTPFSVPLSHFYIIPDAAVTPGLVTQVFTAPVYSFAIENCEELLALGSPLTAPEESTTPSSLPTQYYTDFSEYSINSMPQDWTVSGGASASSTWEIQAHTEAMNGKVLYVQGYYRAVNLLSWDKIDVAPGAVDTEVYCRLKCPSVGGSFFLGVAVRANANSVYGLGIYRGDLRIDLYHHDGAQNTYIGASWGQQGPSVNYDSWYNIRARINSNSLKVKSWSCTTEEPGWQITTTNEELSDCGWVGILTNGRGHHAIGHIDCIGVGTNGASAPDGRPQNPTSTNITPRDFTAEWSE